MIVEKKITLKEFIRCKININITYKNNILHVDTVAITNCSVH